MSLCKNSSGRLFPHQIEVSKRLFDPKSVIPGLLAWHNMGSGKTKTAINAAMNYLKFGSTVIVITPVSNLVKDYSSEFLKIKGVSVKEELNHCIVLQYKTLVQRVPKDLFKFDLINVNNQMNVNNQQNVKELGTKYIYICTNKEIARFLDRRIGELNHYFSPPKNPRKRGLKNYLSPKVNLFKDRFVIIDECDKLLHCEYMGYKTRVVDDEYGPEQGSHPPLKVSEVIVSELFGLRGFNVFEDASLQKLLLMSGTPYFNNVPQDVAKLVSLIRGSRFHIHGKYVNVLNNPNSNTLASFVRPYISYVDNSKDYRYFAKRIVDKTSGRVAVSKKEMDKMLRKYKHKKQKMRLLDSQSDEEYQTKAMRIVSKFKFPTLIGNIMKAKDVKHFVYANDRYNILFKDGNNLLEQALKKKKISYVIVRHGDNVSKGETEIENFNTDTSIKVIVLASDKHIRGTNLRNVRYTHILTTPVSHIEYNQVIARGIRLCSHQELPHSQWTVTVIEYYIDENTMERNIRTKRVESNLLEKFSKNINKMRKINENQEIHNMFNQQLPMINENQEMRKSSNQTSNRQAQEMRKSSNQSPMINENKELRKSSTPSTRSKRRIISKSRNQTTRTKRRRISKSSNQSTRSKRRKFSKSSGLARSKVVSGLKSMTL